jgi:O-antigen/teichoic acid export membrane protein
MSVVRNAANNSLFVFISEVAVRIISFFVTIVLIRYLGSAGFGKYSLVFAFLTFFQIFGDMAVDPIVLRELSRDKGKGSEFLNSAVTLKFSFSIVGLILCWIILQWMNYPADIRMFIYVASLGLLFSFGTLLNTAFQAQLLMKYVVTVTIIMKVVFAIFTILLILLKSGILYFVMLNLIISIAQVIFIYFQSKRILRITLKIDFGIWKQLIKQSWPIALSTFFAGIYTRVNQIMLFRLRSEEELGFYAAGTKITELPIMLAAVFMVSVIPLLSRYAKASPDLFQKTYEKSFKYLMLFIMPVAVLTTVYSKQIILIVYGNSFLSSHTAVAILIWSTVFVYAGIVHSNILLAANLQLLDIIFTGTLLIVNFILNLILIPRYSFIGSAIATTASYSLIFPISYLLKRTRVFAKAMIKSTIKPLLSALFAACLVYFFSPLHSIFNFILTGFIYLFISTMMKSIDSEDIAYFKKILLRAAN